MLRIIQTCALLVLPILLNPGCHKNQREIKIRITPAEPLNEKIYLRDIASDIRYIPLDDHIILSAIRSIDICDDFILIDTYTSILKYDIEGNYQMEMCKVGNAPDELSRQYYFDIDNSTGNIYILDRNIIKVYNKNGDLLRKFPTYESGIFSGITFFDDRLYFSDNSTLQVSDYDWLVSDTIGNIIDFKRNTFENFSTEVSIRSTQFFERNNSIYYWGHLGDTIYELKNGKTIPFAVYIQDEYRFNINELLNGEYDLMTSNTWMQNDMTGTDKFLFLRYSHLKDFSKYYTVYDIENKRFVLLDKASSYDWNVGLENGIDSNLKFFPESKIRINNKVYLVDWIDAIYLINEVNSDNFKDMKTDFPEKKSMLKNLAGKLSENDNPVLILVELK